MSRGEIWWAELPAPVGSRPVMLVSRDAAYSVREMVTVAPVTTRIRGIATEVALGKPEGLNKPCVANCDNLNTVFKSELVRLVGQLSPSRRIELDDAVKYALGLD